VLIDNLYMYGPQTGGQGIRRDARSRCSI